MLVTRMWNVLNVGSVLSRDARRMMHRFALRSFSDAHVLLCLIFQRPRISVGNARIEQKLKKRVRSSRVPLFKFPTVEIRL